MTGVILLDFLGRVKEFFSKLLDKWKNLPTASKVLFGGVAVSIIVVIVIMAVVLAAPGYVPLVSGLSEEQAGYIVQQLDAMGIKYKVEPGRILVSKKYNVYELRMRLASAGILGPMMRGF